MDRRGFLKLLGQASIGAYVAYSFPSIIVPKNIKYIGIERNLGGISFAKLNYIYQKACQEIGEPKVIFMHKDNYTRIIELCQPIMRYTRNTKDNSSLVHNGLSFRNAAIIPSELSEHKVVMGTWSKIKDYNL